MKNKQVCEEFLNGEEARTKNLFSEKANYKKLVLYSYGYHFPLSVMLEDNTILFNTDGYSNTTAQHKGHLARAYGYNNFKDMVNKNNDLLLFNTKQLKEIILNSQINSKVDLIAHNI